MADLERIVRELKDERERLDKAIQALTGLGARAEGIVLARNRAEENVRCRSRTNFCCPKGAMGKIQRPTEGCSQTRLQISFLVIYKNNRLFT
jgi:hypothetical protein